jgi:hypothetical protein
MHAEVGTFTEANLPDMGLDMYLTGSYLASAADSYIPTDHMHNRAVHMHARPV